MNKLKIPGNPRSQLGLTLIEIMIVLIIIGVIASVIGGKLFSAGDKAKVKANGLKMEKLKQSISLYKFEFNKLPTSLSSLVKGESGIPPFAEEDEVVDIWGVPYQYTVSNNGNAFALKSLGADSRDGGDGVNADVTIEGP